jgi:hypothetical protein
VKHRLKVDLQELELALTWRSTASYSYLDLETGAVVSIAAQTHQVLERLKDQLAKRGTRDQSVSLERQLEQLGLLREQSKDELLLAAHVERVRGSRYIPIEPPETNPEYDDAIAFVMAIDEPSLEDHLQQAIDADRTLRRFQDLVYSDPNVHAQWYAFQAARTRQRVLAWLQDRDIEVIML